MAKQTKTLKTEFTSICTATHKAADRMQAWMGDTLAHYVAHGDTSLIRWAFGHAWQTGVKRDAMRAWFKRNGKLDIADTGKGNVRIKVIDKDRQKIDLPKAKGDVFYADKDKKAGKPKGFDEDALIRKIVEKAGAVHEDNSYDQNKVSTLPGWAHKELIALLDRVQSNNKVAEVIAAE